MSAAQPIRAVVLGGSAGSVASLLTILKALPGDYPRPLLLTVHVPPRARHSVLADVLQAHCQLSVGEARDKQPARPGHVYIAPSNYHLLAEADGSLSLSADDPVLFSRPSIDVLFESAADAYGTELAGVLLSGANQDGAQGVRAIHAQGGTVMVEDPASAYAAAMPQAALSACPQARVGTPEQLALYLKHL